MKDLGIKSFNRHDHRIKRKKKDEENKGKQIEVSKDRLRRSQEPEVCNRRRDILKIKTVLKGGILENEKFMKPEDISDEYIDKLIK
jgi:hypothetical protein